MTSHDTPPVSGNLVSDVRALTGCSYEMLASIAGISRPALHRWEQQLPRTRTDTQHAKDVLETLRYAGEALFPHGGAGAVRSWLELPSPDRPIDLLQLPTGPATVRAQVDKEVTETGIGQVDALVHSEDEQTETIVVSRALIARVKQLERERDRAEIRSMKDRREVLELRKLVAELQAQTAEITGGPGPGQR